MAERIEWIDYARGFGMILVVIVHNLTGMVAARLAVPPFAFEFTRLAFSFFLPLFFFLSGLFTERSLQRGIRPFLQAKVSTVLYPFVVWTLIQGSLQSFMSRYVVHAVTLGEILRNMFTHPVAQLWFLEALFLMFVGYALGRHVGMNPVLITLIAVVLSVVAYAVPQEFPNHVLWNFLFLCLGTLLRENVMRLVGSLTLRTLLLAVLVGIVVHASLLGYFHWNSEHTVFSYVYAVLGIGWTIAGSEYLARERKLQWLQSVGRYSMAILLMHIIVLNGMRLVLYRVARLDPRFLFSVPEVVCGIFLPIAVTILLERYHGKWLLEWPRARSRGID